MMTRQIAPLRRTAPRVRVNRNHAETARCEAEKQLRSNSHLWNLDITCDWHEGVLILRGCVHRYYHKQVAQTVAASISGVEQVVNHIEVDR